MIWKPIGTGIASPVAGHFAGVFGSVPAPVLGMRIGDAPPSSLFPSIATRYGVVELQVPVFRCGDCHSMTSGAELLGDEERYRRYSKKLPIGP